MQRTAPQGSLTRRWHLEPACILTVPPALPQRGHQEPCGAAWAQFPRTAMGGGGTICKDPSSTKPTRGLRQSSRLGFDPEEPSQRRHTLLGSVQVQWLHSFTVLGALPGQTTESPSWKVSPRLQGSLIFTVRFQHLLRARPQLQVLDTPQRWRDRFLQGRVEVTTGDPLGPCFPDPLPTRLTSVYCKCPLAWK